MQVDKRLPSRGKYFSRPKLAEAKGQIDEDLVNNDVDACMEGPADS